MKYSVHKLKLCFRHYSPRVVQFSCPSMSASRCLASSYRSWHKCNGGTELKWMDESSNPCLITWLWRTGEEPEDTDFDMPKVYEPIESFLSLKDRLNMFLTIYNESIRGAGMDMVFFRDAMVHLVKVVEEELVGLKNVESFKHFN